MYLQNVTMKEKFLYLTDPYLDAISIFFCLIFPNKKIKFYLKNNFLLKANTRVMTITKAVLDKDAFLGIIGCDVSMNEMQKLFESVKPKHL